MYTMYNHNEIEEEVAKFWKSQEKEIKKSLQYDPKKKLFSFLEGPPTANAPPGLHHVEVRVFKDLFCRFKYMQGFTVPRKGGWDCHGLPVEVQIEKELKLNSKKEILDYGIERFNNKARESVFSHIGLWNELTKKMAYWVDLDEPYITLDNKYIESVWWSLKQLYDNKMLYLGHKVVPFCPRCETPLSSHEVALGYKDITEDTVTITLKVKGKENQYFLAWTTTPWTLPSNLALAVNPNIDYAIVRNKDKEYILAKELVEKYFENEKIIKVVKGSRLEGMKYDPVFPYFKELDNAFRVIAGDFVTTSEGTGIVHMAPAFGEDDYDVCKKNKIAFVQPITGEGKFTSKVKDFFGLFVKDADPKIIKYLEDHNVLFKKEKYTHTYPFCWRCDSALIYYAMLSWFIKVSSVRDKLLKNNEKINWVPAHIKDGRFGNWLEGAKDWALSRKKFWGTPLPIWQCKKCKEETIIGSINELKERGENVSDNIDLHRPYIDKIKIKCKCGGVMERVDDVIDCWYDSGSAAFAQFHYPFENKEMFKKAFPYDFIAEAIDQTRGWFYTLHVLGTLLFENNAYKNVVCAGLLIDEKGEKMSKSKGNIINPWDMFNKVGVDAVRIQMCTTEPGAEKKFSEGLVKESIIPSLRILWNVYVYTSNLKKYSSKNLKLEDRWLISKTNTLVKEFTESLEKHNYHHCTAKAIEFVNEDVSRTYIQYIRDRADDPEVAYTLRYALERILKVMAPFAPYVTDYLNIKLFNAKKTIHLDSWPKEDKKLIDIELEKNMESTREVIQMLLAEREKAQIGIRWPLSKAIISHKCDIKEFSDVIKKQTNIKEIHFKKGELNIELDTKITADLEAEGFAREVTRRIQVLRKNAKLQKQDKVELEIVDKNKILKKFEEEIKEKTGAEKITFSTGVKTKYEFSSKDKIKGEEFEIYLKKK